MEYGCESGGACSNASATKKRVRILQEDDESRLKSKLELENFRSLRREKTSEKES